MRIYNKIKWTVKDWASDKVKLREKRIKDIFIYDFFNEVYPKIRHENGSIVECGIGNGYSFIQLALLRKKEGTRKLYGFDSFNGYSPTNKRWSDNISKRELKEILQKNNIANKTEIFEGYFEQTLPVTETGDIALLHLDCDLASSYKTALTFLYPRVVKGGLIIFSEYKRDSKFPNVTKTINSFLTNSEISSMVCDERINRYYTFKH